MQYMCIPIPRVWDVCTSCAYRHKLFDVLKMAKYIYSLCVFLDAGDITVQGFEKKKAKLLSPYLGEHTYTHGHSTYPCLKCRNDIHTCSHSQ